MRIAVVGASGNVGTAVLRRLESEDVEVVGVARRPPAADAGAPYSGVRWQAADVGTDAVELESAFAGASAVIHLAWQIQPSHERARLRRTNVDGTRNVVEACRRAGVGRLVYASSVGAYAPGPKNERVDESWPTTGIRGSTYSADKAAVERILDEVDGVDGVDEVGEAAAVPGSGRGDPDLAVVRLRPGLTFQRAAGAEILRYFAGPLAPAWLLRYQLLPLVPHSDRLRTQVVHADDVADAYVRAALSDVSGAFNIATEPVVDGPYVAEHFGGRTARVSPAVLSRLAHLSWRAKLQPAEGGWMEMARFTPLMDTGRARRELGWQPRHDAAETLRHLLSGMARGEGTASPVLRPRADMSERARAVLAGRLPGHGEHY